MHQGSEDRAILEISRGVSVFDTDMGTSGGAWM